MRRKLSNVISVLWSMPRMLFRKIVHGGRFKCGLIERFSPNVVLEIWHGGRVELGKRVRAHSGTIFRVLNNGKLKIENDVRINYNCIFMCMDSITVGAGTEFGPSVYVYDHDHDYRVGLEVDEYKTSPVVIGKNCWIGANTMILRGTKIGDNCVVGAGCVLNGEYPDNTVIIQKRETVTKTYEVKR